MRAKGLIGGPFFRFVPEHHFKGSPELPAAVRRLTIPGRIFFAALFFLPAWLFSVEPNGAWGNPAGGPHIIHSRYFVLFGRDMDILRKFESACDRSVGGCGEIFDLPESFPQRIRIVVSDNAVPHIVRSTAGAVILQVNSDLTDDERVIWVIRALLTRYGGWQGVDVPPPYWLIRACQVQIEFQRNPAFRILLQRRLSQREVPVLRERVGSFDLHTEPGWDYLVYKFVESGGLDQPSLRLRLLQFWKNAYDWSQFTAFFETTYPGMNPAELGLLWRTHVSEFLARDSIGSLSEEDSLSALDRLSMLEIRRNNQLEKIAADLWFLFRRDDKILSLMTARNTHLSQLVLRVHPYYFNAFHSLHGMFEAVFRDDLKGFQQAANQFKQDVLDARQLGYETDGVMGRLQR